MATLLIDKNIMVPMRDGIRLATDMYRLDGAAPTPILLSRTPYDKEHALGGSTGVPFDILRAVQAGYAVVIKEVDTSVEEEPPVTIFVMGIDKWRTETDWPQPDTQERPYYLHSEGSANTLQGNGTLSTEPPHDEPPDVYLYNPLRQVPTVGGQVILPGGNAMGPRDQRAVEVRDDVLDRPVEVIGPIEVRLFIASSARDTDFTGKLVDVYPDRRAMILTEGILRARYRTSMTQPELLEPDAVYELQLNLWATANVFLRGHRIRLEVSSSNFPRFNRNSNTGGQIASEAAGHYRPAINRIFHDAAHPSRLILPIIER